MNAPFGPFQKRKENLGICAELVCAGPIEPVPKRSSKLQSIGQKEPKWTPNKILELGSENRKLGRSFYR